MKDREVINMTDQGVRSYRLNLQDPQVLEQIVRTYSEPLIRYAYSLIGSFAAAEDAMEDAIAALLVKGGAFRSEEHLRGWLYRTTRNKSIDYLRRHKREVPWRMWKMCSTPGTQKKTHSCGSETRAFTDVCRPCRSNIGKCWCWHILRALMWRRSARSNENLPSRCTICFPVQEPL